MASYDEVELDLSIGYVGPQGPRGDPGPQGPEGPQGPQGEPGRGIASVEADHDAVVTVGYTDGTSQRFGELARVVEDAEAATAAANAAAAAESWHVSGDTLVLGDSAYVSERRQALVLGRL